MLVKHIEAHGECPLLKLRWSVTVLVMAFALHLCSRRIPGSRKESSVHWRQTRKSRHIDALCFYISKLQLQVQKGNIQFVNLRKVFELLWLLEFTNMLLKSAYSRASQNHWCRCRKQEKICETFSAAGRKGGQGCSPSASSGPSVMCRNFDFLPGNVRASSFLGWR